MAHSLLVNDISDCRQLLFSRGDLIPLQSSILLRIDRGVVRTVTWSEEGAPVILGLWGPGDVVGLPLSRLQSYQIQCLTTVEVRLLQPPIWYQELQAILLNCQQAEELLSIVRQERIHCRLLQLLVWLAQKFGYKVAQGRLIDIQLTHKDLAEMIGTSRVTVTRLLSQFEQHGTIHRRRRKLILASAQ